MTHCYLGPDLTSLHNVYVTDKKHVQTPRNGGLVKQKLLNHRHYYLTSLNNLVYSVCLGCLWFSYPLLCYHSAFYTTCKCQNRGLSSSSGPLFVYFLWRVADSNLLVRNDKFIDKLVLMRCEKTAAVQGNTCGLLGIGSLFHNNLWLWLRRLCVCAVFGPPRIGIMYIYSAHYSFPWFTIFFPYILCSGLRTNASVFGGRSQCQIRPRQTRKYLITHKYQPWNAHNHFIMMYGISILKSFYIDTPCEFHMCSRVYTIDVFAPNL